VGGRKGGCGCCWVLLEGWLHSLHNPLHAHCRCSSGILNVAEVAMQFVALSKMSTRGEEATGLLLGFTTQVGAGAGLDLLVGGVPCYGWKYHDNRKCRILVRDPFGA